MEKKKLLLVAVSVGVVLLIVIGIPLMMIAPRQSQEVASQPINDVERNWGVAAETTRTEPQPEAVVEPPVPAFNAQPVEPVYTPPVAEVPQVTTITVPVPETAAVPNTTVVQPKRTAPVALAPAKQADPKPAASAPSASKETKPVVAKSTSASSNATSGKKYDTYWVQTGAFSTKVRAEGAKESLAAKGIASIIDNRDIDGKTWYRVRVGPYTSENEANYWLALVKTIDGFAESQIRLSQATR